MSTDLIKIVKNSRIAFESKVSSIKKDKALKKFSKLILKNKKRILKENYKDINYARKKKLNENLIKRLELNEKKINSIIQSINQIRKIKDPTDKVLEKWKRPNGLIIKKLLYR